MRQTAAVAAVAVVILSSYVAAQLKLHPRMIGDAAA
jgi:hypothetical protein